MSIYNFLYYIKYMYLIIDTSLKKKIFFFFIFIFWFLLWGAINTLPGEISGFGTSFVKSINALRILIPTIISIITFFFLIKLFFFPIKNFRKYKFQKNLQRLKVNYSREISLKLERNLSTIGIG